MPRIWATFDSFRTESGGFWQDKMGRPVANLDFLGALMSWGSWDQYRFYCADARSRQALAVFFDETLPPARRQLLRVRLACQFLDDQAELPADVVHNGDFTYHLPYLLEARRTLPVSASFATSGITHSLDNVKMQLRYLQILLGRPGPQDRILCTSQCAITLLTQAFAHLTEELTDVFGATPPAPPALRHVPLAISDDYDRIADRSASRTALGLRDNAFTMLWLGRLSLRHKADLAPLLECLQWLERTDQLPPWRLVLAGGAEPPQQAFVRQLIAQVGLEEHVVLAANVPMQDKLALYAASDVFVSLVDNYQETFGLTLLEAQAQGLPALVSDFNGYKELVEDGVTGLRVPTHRLGGEDPVEPLHGLLNTSMTALHRAQRVVVDVPALAECIRTLAHNPHRRREMGVAAMAHVRDYRWPKILALYEAAWEEMARVNDAVRRGDTAAPRGASQLLTPSVARWFDHYTTDSIDDHVPITLTAYGRQRLELNLAPIVYDDLRARMRDGLTPWLLRTLAKQSSTRAHLVDAAAARGVGRSQVLTHLDWLHKHGYCATTHGSGTPSPSPFSR